MEVQAATNNQVQKPAVLIPALDALSNDTLSTFSLKPNTTSLRIANLPSGDPLIQTAAVSSFTLESGRVLDEARIGFTVYATNLKDGENPADREIIVVHPALTGTARFKLALPTAGSQGDGWASSWAGSGVNSETGRPFFFDTDKYTVVGLEHFGGRSIECDMGGLGATAAKELGSDAYQVSLKDGVQLAARVLNEQFDISAVKAVLGGSMGGGQALEWLFQDRLSVGKIFDISGCGVLDSSAKQFFHLQSQFLREDLPISQNIRMLSEMITEALPSQRRTEGFASAVDHVVKRFSQFENGILADPADYEASKLFAVRQLGFLLFVTPEFFEAKREAGINIGTWLDNQGARFARRFDSDGLACLCSMIANAEPLEAETVVARLRDLNATQLIRSANMGDTLFPAEQQLAFNRDIRIPLTDTPFFTEYYSRDLKNGHDRFLSAAFLQDDAEFLRLKLEDIL